jgi:hypothetical protein
MHRFWQCPRATTSWEQAFSFLYSLKSPIDSSSAWRLSLEQCMFNKKFPSKLKKFSLLWSLMRDGVLDYNRLEWQHTLQKIKRT